MARQSRRKPSSPWLKILGVLVLLGMLGVMILALMIGPWLRDYLTTDAFRQKVAEELGKHLQAEVEIAPLRAADQTLFTTSVRIVPNEDGPFREASLRDLRLRITPPSLGHWFWEVSDVEIAALTLDAMRQPTRTLLPRRRATPVATSPPAPPPFWMAWLPTNVRLEPLRIRDFTVRWGDNEQAGGVLERANVRVTIHPDRIEFLGNGGRLRQPGAPVADIREVEGRLKDDRLFITWAQLSVDAGRIEVTGEVGFEERTSVDLRLAFEQIDLARFLEPAWQSRISGRLEGKAHLQGVVDENVKVNGQARATGLIVTALPVLDQLAIFTTLQAFRRLSIQQATADFQWRPGLLELENLSLEAQGLFFVKGHLTIEGERLAGNLDVGLTSRSLQWIPGARDKVFTETNGIYRTTPVRISGTRQRPKEDLTPRLVTGAAQSTTERALDVADDLQKVPGKAIDTLFELLE